MEKIIKVACFILFEMFSFSAFAQNTDEKDKDPSKMQNAVSVVAVNNNVVSGKNLSVSAEPISEERLKMSVAETLKPSDWTQTVVNSLNTVDSEKPSSAAQQAQLLKTDQSQVPVPHKP